jgi:hypothetical protein
MSQPPPQAPPILKNPVLQRLDELCRDPLKRDALLADLKDASQDYVDILVKHGGAKDYEAEHLRHHWYHRDGGWWGDEPTAAIVRQGLIHAIELATRDPETGAKRAQALTIDSYWVLLGNQFAVIVTCSDTQVTRLVVAPGPPLDPAAQLPDKAPIWVIKRSSGAEKPGDERTGEVVEHVEEKSEVVTVRSKGFRYIA